MLLTDYIKLGRNEVKAMQGKIGKDKKKEEKKRASIPSSRNRFMTKQLIATLGNQFDEPVQSTLMNA